ncbi:MAG: cyclic nucleotide-binding domain-containing protein [Candidatus Handelsmanbacteria bacterium]|nr:cyclic nucleotide-binding domain-containing protein [Candidatus Handelsmanbacteria bacterium]
MPEECAKPATSRTYADGKIIIEQGSVCEFMYIVRRGQVEILHNDQGALTQKAVLHKGSFFGEVPLWSASSPPASPAPPPAPWARCRSAPSPRRPSSIASTTIPSWATACSRPCRAASASWRKR